LFVFRNAPPRVVDNSRAPRPPPPDADAHRVVVVVLPRPRTPLLTLRIIRVVDAFVVVDEDEHDARRIVAVRSHAR